MTWTSVPLAQSVNEVGMPDLAHLRHHNALRLMFGSVFGGFGVPPVSGSHAHADYKTFVRRVERALAEYQRTRESMLTFVGRPNNDGPEIGDFIDAMNSLEACIGSLHRCLVLADRLKGAVEAPIHSADLRPFETGTIRGLRDGIEHVDNLLRSGEIPSDGLIAVRLYAEGFEFLENRISYDKLARWLTRLSELAERLVFHDPLARDRKSASR